MNRAIKVIQGHSYWC